MGDRCNIRFRAETGDQPIYFYSHWGGDQLPIVLQNALKQHKRWDDDQYLSRIIFCAMIKDAVSSEHGFGISLRLYDNEHPIINVNVETQTVSWCDNEWSFEQYIAVLSDVLREHWENPGWDCSRFNEPEPAPVAKLSPPESLPPNDGIRRIEMQNRKERIP